MEIQLLRQGFAMNDLAGMKVLISGGASGIGLATARALLERGAGICIGGRNADRLRAAQSALREHGEPVEVLAFDVADRSASFAAVARLHAQWGRIDALVNNAGIYKAAPFLSFEPGDFESLFQTNLMGCVNLMQAVLPHMISRRSGRIVNIASTAGKWGSMNQSAYNVTKHAVVGLTRCVALEMGAHAVTVNAICPGIVETEMLDDLLQSHARINNTDPASVLAGFQARIPLRRAIRPEEIAGLAAYLLSPAAAGMTGQSILYDGGMLQV